VFFVLNRRYSERNVFKNPLVDASARFISIISDLGDKKISATRPKPVTASVSNADRLLGRGAIESCFFVALMYSDALYNGKTKF